MARVSGLRIYDRFGLRESIHGVVALCTACLRSGLSLWIVMPIFLVLAYSPVTAAEVVVKIAHVAPLTGPQSHYGLDNEAGAKLAVDDLNAMGLVLDGKKAKFELVSLDDRASGVQAGKVANTLCTSGVAGVVGHMNSAATLVASKIYYQCNLPMITPSATNPQITQQGFSTVFRMIASDAAQAIALAEFALSKSFKNILVVDDSGSYGKPLADLFVDKLRVSGGQQRITRATVANDQQRFDDLLRQISSLQPDALFFGGMDSQAGAVLKQMRLDGSQAIMLGGDGICTLEMMRISDGAADERVVCAQGGIPVSAMKKGAALSQRVKKIFRRPMVMYAPYSYDATISLGMAMKDAGSASPIKYLPALRKLRYEGLTGDIAFDKHGDVVNAAVSIYTFDTSKGKSLLEVLQ